MINDSEAIAIMTDEPGWHGRVLTQALHESGLTARYVSLLDCSFQIDDHGIKLHIPGFETALPKAVFVRGIPGGTLEQVIHRLNVLHYLNRINITVFNEASAIERTVDKSMASLLLAQAGVPSVQTWVTESKEHARGIIQQEKSRGNTLVIKPVFGSQGMGIQKLESIQSLEDEHFHQLFYLQRYIKRLNDYYTDIRVLVIRRHIVAAMVRKSEHWITNRAQGALCERYVPDSRICQIAIDAATACEIDYAGVDIIFDGVDAVPRVLEVNSIPAWWGLQKVTGINIAAQLIDAFCACIAEKSPEKLKLL